MDIAALSMSMSASRLATNMGIALLSKVLDTAEATGEILDEMMTEIPTSGLGEMLDIRV